MCFYRPLTKSALISNQSLKLSETTLGMRSISISLFEYPNTCFQIYAKMQKKV